MQRTLRYDSRTISWRGKEIGYLTTAQRKALPFKSGVIRLTVVSEAWGDYTIHDLVPQTEETGATKAVLLRSGWKSLLICRKGWDALGLPLSGGLRVKFWRKALI
jgi:hypothetical protein